jgi:hypothetical protein
MSKHNQTRENARQPKNEFNVTSSIHVTSLFALQGWIWTMKGQHFPNAYFIGESMEI